MFEDSKCEDGCECGCCDVDDIVPYEHGGEEFGEIGAEFAHELGVRAVAFEHVVYSYA